MYTPLHTFGTSILPVASVDVTLHTFLGVSWMILLPYTIFGAALMIYSQSRLMRGQRAIKREERLAASMTAQ